MKNQTFNFERFLAYSKYALHTNWQKKILTASALIIAYIILVVFSIRNSNSNDIFWEPIVTISSIVVVLFLFYNAFAAFRQKESTMHFLTIPASNMEKFTYEIGMRFIILFLIFPLLMIIIGNSTVSIYAHIEAIELNLIAPKPYGLLNSEIFKSHTTSMFMLILGVLASGIYLITGGVVFKKNPAIKTFLIIGAITGTVTIYMNFVINKIGLRTFKQSVMVDSEYINTIAYTIFSTICIWCIIYAYFKLKEKEI